MDHSSLLKVSDTLHPDKRKNMFHYSCSKYYFHRGKFEEAMRNFHKVQLNVFLLKIDLKNIMLMTYYELGLYENALTLIDAYKHFLSYENVLSSVEKRKCKNFILLLSKMIGYKEQKNSVIKHLIKKNLESDVFYKSWIMEKYDELDRSYVKSA
jgi:tetratricopeptide (TPR) repeat protein